jgi:hypothetical protein
MGSIRADSAIVFRACAQWVITTARDCDAPEFRGGSSSVHNRYVRREVKCAKWRFLLGRGTGGNILTSPGDYIEDEVAEVHLEIRGNFNGTPGLRLLRNFLTSVPERRSTTAITPA